MTENIFGEVRPTPNKIACFLASDDCSSLKEYLEMENFTNSSTDEVIVLGLKDGLAPHDIASSMVDHDVASKEYEGCSSEMEMAYNDYLRRVERIQEALLRV